MVVETTERIKLQSVLVFLFVSLQTPTYLLTPSPLLSNIHFWSTLSPVAQLSPATLRQGGHLFQVSVRLHRAFRLVGGLQG